MNIVKMHSRVLRRLAWFLLAVMLVTTVAKAKTEETFDVLHTRTATYTNVTVTTKDKSYIFILHSAGMGSIKITDLPYEVQVQLGYAVATNAAPTARPAGAVDESATTKTNGALAILAKELAGFTGKLKPLIESWQGRGNQAGGKPELALVKGPAANNPAAPFIGLGILLAVYLFFCYCSHLICLKAQSPGGILVWIPILQIFPMLRAAGMSGWWFLALFIPIVSFVAQILWAINICKAREKSVLIAVLLIFPLTTVLAYIYLAFSSGPQAPPAPKYKSMSLATA